MHSDDKKVERRRGFSAVPILGDFVALTRLVRDREQPGWLKLLVALALVYVVSPVDAMPELVAPLVAWLDDVGLLLALRLALSRRLDPYRYPLFEQPPAQLVAPAAEADPIVYGSPSIGR